MDTWRLVVDGTVEVDGTPYVCVKWGRSEYRHTRDDALKLANELLAELANPVVKS